VRRQTCESPETNAFKENHAMADDLRPREIGDLPAQYPLEPGSAAEARGRFFNTGNAFDIVNPPVPDHVFTREPRLALDAATPTGLIPCDISDALGCPFPATSPLILARYARIRMGETLTTDFVASGAIAYVILGRGVTVCGAEQISWSAGDLFVLPGGRPASHTAATTAVLWLATNEPQLAFECLRAPSPGRSPTDLVHYRAAEIDRQIALLHDIGRNASIAGSALIFSAERQEATRNILPTLTAAMNSLPAGLAQPPHRHNSVAVSLIVQGENCYSIVDGRRKNWSPWATTITPPVSVHSHHNGGDQQARFLIIQDGGIYYHTRAMGFEFAEQPS
jgi:quercetin dioxygenase-like cupin family protein